jgi:hypothetical protein
MLSTVNKNDLLKMIPGKRYYHYVIMTDDLNNSASTSFRVAIEHWTGDIHLVSDEMVSSVHVGSGIQLRGKPGARAVLILETISSRDVFTRLEVELAECPPGYTLDDSLQCACNADAYIGLFKYITILYTILLIVAFVLIMNKCRWQCLEKFHRITDMKTSVIHGISTCTFLMTVINPRRKA